MEELNRPIGMVVVVAHPKEQLEVDDVAEGGGDVNGCTGVVSGVGRVDGLGGGAGQTEDDLTGVLAGDGVDELLLKRRLGVWQRRQELAVLVLGSNPRLHLLLGAAGIRFPEIEQDEV